MLLQLLPLGSLIITTVGFCITLYLIYRYFRLVSQSQNSSGGVVGIPNQVSMNPPSTMKSFPMGFFLYLFLSIQAIGIIGVITSMYFSNKIKLAPPSANVPAVQTVVLKPTATPTTSPTRAISREVELEFLRPLYRFEKGVLVKSVISNTYSGKVGHVIFDPSRNDENYFKIGLTGSLGYKNQFWYKQETLKGAKIVKLIGGKEEPIDFKEIKKGDKIDIVSVIDLLGTFPNNRIELSIYKQE